MTRTCPNCSNNMFVPDKYAQVGVRCKRCGSLIPPIYSDATPTESEAKEIHCCNRTVSDISAKPFAHQKTASQFYAGEKAYEKTFQENSDEVDYETLVLAHFPAEVQRRKPVVTIGLIGASVLMAVVMSYKFHSLDPDPEAFVAMGANIDSLTGGGQLWRLFTSSFLHFGLKHLACNMLCLFFVGAFLEKLIGGGKLFSVYFLTALSGGLLSLAFHENTACAGASGAVFGLFGATVAYIAFVYRDMGIEVANVAGYMKSGLVFIGINFIYSLMPGVDMAGHVGGLLGGLVVGGVLGAPVKWKTMRNRGWFGHGLSIATAILLVVMLISCFAANDVGRLDTKALAVEVGNLIKEKMVEGIKGEGGSNVTVEIDKLVLFRDGGDNYHGLVEMTCKYDGETEKITKTLKVNYDGTQFMYQLDD